MRNGAEGAEDELRALVTQSWSRLFRTAYLLTGDHHEAEDLVQATLVKACAKWHRVRSSDDPYAYLRRILVTSNVDRLRRRRVREWLTFRPPEPATADLTDRVAERVADRDAVVRALSRLPARQRLTVVLRYLEDLSETEVARLLGTRVGTVRSQTARGLARLRADGSLAGLARRRRTAVAEGGREVRAGTPAET